MNTNDLNLKIKKLLGQRVKGIMIFFLFWQRNSFLLFNITNRVKKNSVNLNYWIESPNLGDALSPLIVNYMLSLRMISPDVKVQKTKHLYAVGSVLTAGIQDCTVWGSGVLNASLTYRLLNRKFDIRAVRGPLTRAILIDYGFDVPEIFGDPAILLPEIYTPINITIKAKYGLIMHKDYVDDGYILNDMISINICTSDYKKFVDQLNSVEIVISSSLHGIILAESYGIRAILLKPQIDLLKYYDWYYSTNRIYFPIIDKIQDVNNTTPAKLPDLETLRNTLKEVFPYDLYGKM